MKETKEGLYVIKIGGNIIDHDSKLSEFLKEFANVRAKKILVHGGGKLATEISEKLGVQQTLLDGRRITDGETLKIVTMVYAGYINKNIVAQLQANDCNAMGLSGADGNAILAHKRIQDDKLPDFGFAGDIDVINVSFLVNLLENNLCPVIAPITHNRQGQLLNTNADTIAQELAKAMSRSYEVTLVYSFEKSGVLTDVNDESTVIPELNWSRYQQLKSPDGNTGTGKIFAGMIPKLDNAFKALDSGVRKVIIGKAEQLSKLIASQSGTTLVYE